MVLLIVIITSVITFFVVLVSTIAYLITLIVDESDDANTDALGIDAQDFSLTPVDSPLDYHLNHNHHNGHNHYTHSTIHELGGSRRSSEVQGNDPEVAATSEHITASDEAALRSIKDSERVSLLDTPILLNFGSSQQQTPTDARATIPKMIDDGLSHESEPSRDSLRSWQSTPTVQKTLITSQLGAAVSKQVFDDFDSRDMQLGGTALHWCKTRRSLDKLIKLGLPTEILNKRHETALHVAVRRRKLSVLIGLLVQGANIESRNENGETPLILACKVNDIFACQLLLVFDADFDAQDNLGNSARHYAAGICERHKRVAQQLPSAAHLILAMLSEIGAKRCPRAPEPISKLSKQQRKQSQSRSASLAKSCADGCSATGNYNGNSYNRWPDYQAESLYKRHMFANIIESRLQTAKQLKESEPSRSRWTWRPWSSRQQQQQAQATTVQQQVNRSRLLCIDGGGLRGVIVCQIMIELQKYLKRPIVDYFDWIGGTSVGGFLACALGTGTGLKELRRICFDVKDEVFSGTRPYNSKFIERVLKRTYGPTKRMSDIKNKQLAVTTVIADREPCQLRFFRNYKSPSQLLEMYGFEPNKFNTISAHSTVPKPTTSAAGGANESAVNQRQPLARQRNFSLPTACPAPPKDGSQSACNSKPTVKLNKTNSPVNPKGKELIATQERATSSRANQDSEGLLAALSPEYEAQSAATPTDKSVASGPTNLSSMTADSRINQADKKNQTQRQQWTAAMPATAVDVSDSKGNKAEPEITIDRDSNTIKTGLQSDASGAKQFRSGNDLAGGSYADRSTDTREDSSNSSDYIIEENDQDPLIWQAVRASAAAPFFFKPYGPYLDGGIISNNPTLDMLSEFSNYQKVREFIRKRSNVSFKITTPTAELNDAKKRSSNGGDSSLFEPASKLDLVVSLGTGRGRVIGRQAMVDLGQVASGFATVFSPRELVRSIRAARDLFRKLMQQSCHTEDHILDRAQAWCSSLDIPYFRINPALTTIFSIDDKRDEQLINALWQTKLYMKAMRPQLKELADILDAQQ